MRMIRWQEGWVRKSVGEHVVHTQQGKCVYEEVLLRKRVSLILNLFYKILLGEEGGTEVVSLAVGVAVVEYNVWRG